MISLLIQRRSRNAEQWPSRFLGFWYIKWEWLWPSTINVTSLIASALASSRVPASGVGTAVRSWKIDLYGVQPSSYSIPLDICGFISYFIVESIESIVSVHYPCPNLGTSNEIYALSLASLNLVFSDIFINQRPYKSALPYQILDKLDRLWLPFVDWNLRC